MTKEELIIYWSDKILVHLLEQRKEHTPQFTFWLRKQDSERLRKGYWFQGSDYIFLGVVNKGDWKNKTRQAGLVFDFKDAENPNAYLVLAFQSETDEAIINCYEEIQNRLGGFVKKGFRNYLKNYNETNFIKIISLFFII